MPLALSWVGPETASRSVILLHGILGSKGNLRSLARRFTANIPQTRVALIDLRGHGESTEYAQLQGGPHTVDSCVEDIRQVMAQQNASPDAIIGHSFGGKVALRYAERYPSGLRQAWALDTSPGIKQAEGGGEVGMVVRTLEQVSPPFSTREAMMGALEERGLSSGIARWMTTNLVRTSAGFTWAFDLGIVRELLESYFVLDLWPWLESRRGTPNIHLLRATGSDRYSPEEIKMAQALPPQSRVFYHELENSGHWVHADNPDGLLSILTEHFS